MNKYLLYIPVFISGGAVLVLEILGTRILGPFYGVSIFLWSALISITLLALSFGYFLGGMLADKKPFLNVFAILFGAAGLWVLFVPLLAEPVINSAEPFGLRWAVLVSSFILFVPPLTVLGMISPFAVKLNTNSLNTVARSAGNLYAVSTAGSVVFALLTGFILIPGIGVKYLTFSTGIALLVTSLLLIFYSAKIKEKITAAVLIIITAAAGWGLISEEINGRIIAEIQSPYAEIKIIEDDFSRMLLIDGGIHSMVDKTTMENNHSYVWVLEAAKNFFDYKGDILLIGLGAGSVHSSFYEDGWDVESVEIDPAVTSAAEKYFNFNSSSSVVHHADGREFLRNSEKKYDLVILDAFGSSSIPFHLITKEAFNLVKKRLNENGFFVLNIEAEEWNDIIVRSVSATLQESFRNTTVLPIAEPPNTLGNIIIVASDNDIKLKQELDRNYSDPGYRFSANYERVHAWDNRFEPELKGVPVITDDLNPVDIWSERINYTARKDLRKYLKEIGF